MTEPQAKAVPDPATPRDTPPGTRRFFLASTWSPLLILIAVLVIGGSLVRGVHGSGGTYASLYNQRDYDNIYAGGWCMLHHCDPYNIVTLDTVLRSQGRFVVEDKWLLNLPIYPPTTLVLATPLAALPYVPSILAWALLNRGIWMLAVLWAFLCGPLLRGVPLWRRIFVVALLFASWRINHGLTYGNPVYLVSGLLLFVTTDLSPRRKWIHAAMLFVAIILKPQVAIPFAAIVFFRSRFGRQTIYATAAALAAFTAATLAYAATSPATARWPAGLAKNLRLGQSAGLSMSPSYRAPNVADDSMLHLQYLYGYWTGNDHLSQLLALATATILLAFLIFPLLRAPRIERTPTLVWSEDLYLAALAATTLWMFLPVYHRWSDLSMMAIPLLWSLRATAHLRVRALAATVLVIASLIVWKSWLKDMYPVPGTGTIHTILAALFYRSDAMLVLIITIVAIAALWRTSTPADARHAAL